MKKLYFLLLFYAVLITGCSTQTEESIESRGQTDINKKINPTPSPSQTSADAIHTMEYLYNEPSNRPQQVSIKIYKEKRVLELYGDGNLIARFPVGLGFSPQGHKQKEGDGRTPEGKYYLCTINDQSSFTLFYGISYPGTEDAKNAFDENRITRSEYMDIKNAQEAKTRPLWNTDLGGEVGIHGGGDSRDWTWGCIALSDENIVRLSEYVMLKTPVEIYP